MCPPTDSTFQERGPAVPGAAPATTSKQSFGEKMGFAPTIFSGTWYLQEGIDYYKNNKIQLKNEILSGLTVAIAQVPESVAFR